MLLCPGMNRSFLVLALLCFSGCAGSVGPSGDVVGGPCTATGGCAGGSRCLVEGDFPGGSCTIDCTGPGMCPSGSMCVQENGGTCLDLCSSDADCREGYSCVSKSLLNTSGEALVCMGG